MEVGATSNGELGFTATIGIISVGVVAAPLKAAAAVVSFFEWGATFIK